MKINRSVCRETRWGKKIYGVGRYEILTTINVNRKKLFLIEPVAGTCTFSLQIFRWGVGLGKRPGRSTDLEVYEL
jgi:hypothetical protein